MTTGRKSPNMQESFAAGVCRSMRRACANRWGSGAQIWDTDLRLGKRQDRCQGPQRRWKIERYSEPEKLPECPGFNGHFPQNQLWVTVRVTRFLVIQKVRN